MVGFDFSRFSVQTFNPDSPASSLFTQISSYLPGSGDAGIEDEIGDSMFQDAEMEFANTAFNDLDEGEWFEAVGDLG